MNTKNILTFAILASIELCSTAANAAIINTQSAGTNTFKINLAGFSIPAAVGGETWYDDWNVYNKLDVISSSQQGYAVITVNGTVVGTASTGGNIYATSNPGIGITYEINYSTPSATTPQNAYAPGEKLVFTTGAGYNGYMHVKYAIVRLLQHVPSGTITSVPDVTISYINPAGSGYADKSVLVYSGIASQPKITACKINAPSEIELPAIYGNSLVNGAQGVTNAPTITLENCPGAITGISYNFAATYYNTCGAANGIFCTQHGAGYANGVDIQIQNADGSPHQINSAIPLNNYNGSGDYNIPDFKVAYYISDKDVVTAGKVASAIDLTVSYN
ncbi:fimbrial protein [Salmonella enterica]|nr:fimbrial protein [Salmonella enterica]